MFSRLLHERIRPVEVLQERLGTRVERAVWRGEQVLVKTLTSDDPEMIMRFQREGDIAARLSTHPNIVPLLGHTRTQLIYRFIEGGDLRCKFERGVLEVREAVDLMRGLMAAIGHAHARGITHLDLKPENILLEGGRVRVTDFGLSHDRAAPRITRLGERFGTPHYMPPEQYKGVRNDPRSDLYSAGVILFEALAGTPPYRDPFSWLAGIRDERVPLPHPQALHPLLEMALARDPARRPSSAIAFLIELERAAEQLRLDG
ncbi:serine/threonine-protein kinase [Deinococcus peraridilitoris]|uniref:Protein kinase family protein n=1 Tax=Deinococcus peraridilitoris (strain DSM 19664 / LMG 22246 / CIP 109416 / KR-200) TaxID=937777 RepID=L0A6T4_DEIPD|nr:serine/threonine-protein kinase [Deinococcus peraridilitoris]AFZ68902.1 protein kinase family protein [Deinococcus peraridilitoris DSM 19664]